MEKKKNNNLGKPHELFSGDQRAAGVGGAWGAGNCFSEQLNLKLFRPLTLQMWVAESIL